MQRRKPNLDHVTDVQWAYLAGIIDGEGCIRILRSDCIKHRKTPRYTLQLYVGNTDPRLISWLRDTFGGYVHYRPRKNVKHRPAWVWEMHYNDCTEVMKKCLPFFHIKREQAEVALAFKATADQVPHPKAGVPPEIIELRESYRQKLMVLKDVSVHPPVEGVISKHLGTWNPPMGVKAQ